MVVYRLRSPFAVGVKFYVIMSFREETALKSSSGQGCRLTDRQLHPPMHALKGIDAFLQDCVPLKYVIRDTFQMSLKS